MRRLAVRIAVDVAVAGIVVLILASLGGCVASPAAPSGGDTAAPPETKKPTVTLLLPEWANTQNIQQQIDGYNSDPKSLAMIAVNSVSSGEYSNNLRLMLEAGTMDADVAVLVNNGDIQTFQEVLTPWDTSALEDFLSGGRKSVSVDETPLGVPWLRNWCTTTYYHLAIFKQASEEREVAAKDAVAFLTAPGQQTANLLADSWYPTHSSVNGESPQCGEGSSSMATAAFDQEVANQIAQSSELNALKEEMEAKLKEAGLLPEGTTILLDRLAYYVEGAEGKYITEPGTYDALVAAPIALPDGSSLPLPPEPPATLEQAVALVSLGKLVIENKDDEKVVTFTPESADALVLKAAQFPPQDVNDLSAYLLSLNGESRVPEYGIEDVFGVKPLRDPSEMTIGEFVTFAYASPGKVCKYGTFLGIPYCICITY